MIAPALDSGGQPPAAPIRRITVLQGQARVSGRADDELTTILGSCVATCLFDPVAGIGGMNHFLLPEPPDSHDPAQVDVHYGVYLMEILINDMLRHGAGKERLRAHLYGGANLRAGMAPIGTANAAFARSFLERERIPLLRESLGGTQARRIEFRPATGQVRSRVVENRLAREAPPIRRPAQGNGEVELF
ncbi:chemotaxis protein CheD [Novosphingobium bradum]|uniref:Probable chemoreceptor glutamine deamidase CheD n=1 Tax=Novosphingobium bradum TaxID=1737444 RepID=A0ABV7IQ72_9SPHN